MSATQLEVKVVGLTFVSGYPENLTQVNEFVVNAQKNELGWAGDDGPDRVEVVLVRNPANEHDANAVEVHVPMLGRQQSMVGHVPRDLAARLAPSLDRGDRWSAKVNNVLVNPEHPDRPGLEIVLSRVATQAA